MLTTSHSVFSRLESTTWDFKCVSSICLARIFLWKVSSSLQQSSTRRVTGKEQGDSWSHWEQETSQRSWTRAASTSSSRRCKRPSISSCRLSTSQASMRSFTTTLLCATMNCMSTASQSSISMQSFQRRMSDTPLSKMSLKKIQYSRGTSKHQHRSWGNRLSLKHLISKPPYFTFKKTRKEQSKWSRKCQLFRKEAPTQLPSTIRPCSL